MSKKLAELLTDKAIETDTKTLPKKDKLKKEAEKEVKKRLDEGQLFSRLSYSKQQYTRVLAMDNAAKMALIRKYGLDSVVPLIINQLEKKYGESVYEDIQPYIVENPKAQSIKWDA